MEGPRSENESDPKDLRAEQRLGEMIEGEEDESWASTDPFLRTY